MEELYTQLFRRKSFHKFGQTLPLTQDDEIAIQEAVDSLRPLVEGIQVKTRIVPGAETNCYAGAEKCILFYSEKKDNYLMNIGYMGEQLDLKLVELGLGTLWFGLGKTDEKELDGLEYVIMMAVSRVPSDSFRKDMFKSKRKALSEIWDGEVLPFSDIVRFAPSACNSQPWFVRNNSGCLEVSRFRKKGFTGLIPMAFVSRFNRIDIGIFLLVLEVCMAHEGISFSRQLFVDDTPDSVALTKVAEYRMI